MTEPIQVYRFEDAPKDLQELASQGGDEDWLIVIPPGYIERHKWNVYGIPLWLEHCDSLGRPTRLDLPDGRTLLVGSH